MGRRLLRPRPPVSQHPREVARSTSAPGAALFPDRRLRARRLWRRHHRAHRDRGPRRGRRIPPRRPRRPAARPRAPRCAWPLSTSAPLATRAGRGRTIRGASILIKNVPGVETAYQENVPENPADAERVIRDFAHEGASMSSSRPRLATWTRRSTWPRTFPDIVFVHISGYKTARQRRHRLRQDRRAPLRLGPDRRQMTKTNPRLRCRLPDPEVIRGLNAFARRAQGQPGREGESRLDQHLV